METRMDRTTRGLLLLLVIGVWGLLLKPVFTPAPAHAGAGGKYLHAFTKDGISARELDEYGKADWEVVSFDWTKMRALLQRSTR